MFANDTVDPASPNKVYAPHSIPQRMGTSFCSSIFRPSITYEMKPRGATHVAAIFRRGLLIAVTNTGYLLLYSFPLGRDQTMPLSEWTINAGVISKLLVDEMNGRVMMASLNGSISIFGIEALNLLSNPPTQQLWVGGSGAPSFVSVAQCSWPEMGGSKYLDIDFILRSEERDATLEAQVQISHSACSIYTQNSYCNTCTILIVLYSV
ncbi:uncharacterized protein [Physcomitrium patens]|uniref:uncharacterized protein n=1 Tax=Physcomitrium patens TaxID=3218 RepID=UPI003CCE4B1B